VLCALLAQVAARCGAAYGISWLALGLIAQPLLPRSEAQEAYLQNLSRTGHALDQRTTNSESSVEFSIRRTVLLRSLIRIASQALATDHLGTDQSNRSIGARGSGADPPVSFHSLARSAAVTLFAGGVRRTRPAEHTGSVSLELVSPSIDDIHDRAAGTDVSGGRGRLLRACGPDRQSHYLVLRGPPASRKAGSRRPLPVPLTTGALGAGGGGDGAGGGEGI
jgi:hypothetical protein